MECAAMRRVRETMGLKNLKIMVPFCRRLEEADRVLAAMAEEGLERGKDGLEIYVMCEIPANVILIDEFAERFDGFSIGSNDLTQLTLGVDRDSQMVAFDFDERDPAVMAFLKQAVEGARRNGRHCGICGQAPSDYPEIAEFLVELRHRLDQRHAGRAVAHDPHRARGRGPAGPAHAAIVGQRDLRGENHAHPPHPGDASSATAAWSRAGPESTVHAAARLMAENGCGSILVMEGERLLGNFTERDLLTRVAATEKSPRSARTCAR